MQIAGLDIGTTGCKLTVFDESGQYLDKAYFNYPVNRNKSEHEINAEDIINGVLFVMKVMAEKYKDIKGIGITSFGETFVFTDEKGKPLHNCMLDTDARGVSECEELIRKMDGKTIASITGLKPHEMYSIPKMMWVKKNMPDVYKRAAHAFLMEDFVVFRLTGKAQIDYSLASRTMAFDITSLKWSEDIFKMADIDMNLMSQVVPSGTIAGNIKEEISRTTGMKQTTQIVSISHDQVSAAIGAGVFDSDKAVDGAGTVECITVVYDELPELDIMYKGNYAVVPYVIPGKYLAYAFSYTGGALIQWCIENLAKKEKEEAAKKNISVNEKLERLYKKKNGSMPSGMLVLPHFAGAATPYMDTGSKGAIIGLDVGSTVCDIYHACMEGVVYEMLLNLEMLKESGIHYNMLVATGGGARSEVWMQMKADILNMPVAALKTADAGTVGCAMLTGIAVGCFTNINDASVHMVKNTCIYYPDQKQHERYMKIYTKYRNVYQAVRPLVG